MIRRIRGMALRTLEAVIHLLTERETTLLEFFGSSLLVLWGIATLLLPGVFSPAELLYGGRYPETRPLWGILLVAISSTTIFGNLRQRYQARRNGAFLSAWLFGVFFFGAFDEAQVFLLAALFGLLSFSQAIVYLILRHGAIRGNP